MQLRRCRTTLRTEFSDKQLISVGNSVVRSAIKIVFSALAIVLVTMAPANARVVSPLPTGLSEGQTLSTTQQGCMSLSQAIDSVRRRGNVERVISANTRTSGGRETHHIKVLTKDGKVKTHKIQGRKRGNG